MSSEIVVKTYLQTGNGSQDIRRFSFDSKSDITWEAILQKLTETYFLASENIKLFWKGA